MADRASQRLTRQWAIVRCLHERSPRGISVAHLVDELGVHRRTFYRDLKVLEHAGVPIERDTVAGETRYALAQLRPMPTLRASGALLAYLAVIRAQLDAVADAQLRDEVDAMLGVVTAPPHLEVAKQSPLLDPSILRTIESATRRGLRLELRYRSRSRDAWRIVDPLRVRVVRSVAYLIAWDLEERAPRTLRLARIAKARREGSKVDPHHVDLDATFSRAVGMWEGPATHVAVRLSPGVAAIANDWPLMPDQTVTTQADGSIVVRATVAGTVEATRWVLGWGADAEVLEPAELRRSVREELMRALAQYGPGLRRAQDVTNDLSQRAGKEGERRT